MTVTQTAPWPDDLEDLVDRIRYDANWRFLLYGDYDRGQGSVGTTLIISITCEDSYHPEVMRTVNHLFIVPAASYNRKSWSMWLFDRIMDVHRHEAMENFRILLPHEEGSELEVDRPYAPHHGPGEDPYTVFVHGTERDVRTSFRGDINP